MHEPRVCERGAGYEFAPDSVVVADSTGGPALRRRGSECLEELLGCFEARSIGAVAVIILRLRSRVDHVISEHRIEVGAEDIGSADGFGTDDSAADAGDEADLTSDGVEVLTERFGKESATIGGFRVRAR